MDDEIKASLRAAREKEVDAYDDTNLTITESLFLDLRVFEMRCDEHGIAYQHFTDWHGLYDLPALQETGFIRRAVYLKPRNDGWRFYFPEAPFELTIRARKLLRQPSKYIADSPATDSPYNVVIY